MPTSSIPRYYRFVAVLGVVLLAMSGGVLALAGAPDRLDVVALQAALLAVVGVLFVLAGVQNPIRSRVGSHRLAGVADVLLGVVLPLGALSGAETPFDYGLAAVAALGGLSLVLIGVDFLRGGRWFDVPTT